MSHIRLALLLTLVLSVGVVSIACGGDDDDGGSSETPGGSLDAYFADLGAIGNDFLGSLVLQPQGLDTSAPISDQIDVYQTYLEGISRDIENAKNDLDDLDPPPEAAGAHADLLAAVENAQTVAEDLEAEVGDINASEDMQALSGNTDILTAIAGFRTACLALADIAEQNNITREVRCE